MVDELVFGATATMTQRTWHYCLLSAKVLGMLLDVGVTTVRVRLYCSAVSLDLRLPRDQLERKPMVLRRSAAIQD